MAVSTVDDAARPVRPRRKPKATARDEELIGRPEIAERLEKVFQSVEKGFRDQIERADKQLDLWDAYNCELSRYQNYTGDVSNLFVPIIRNGINALVTRYVNQAFPQSGRHVEVLTGEEDQPYALVSLIEHYIEKGMLRTQAAPALLTNGQVEGQYNCLVHWDRVERHVVSRETKPIEVDGVPMPEMGDVEMTLQERIDDDCPAIEVLHDADVLVLPATAPTIDAALERGGSVTVALRWSKEMIRQKIDDGEIIEDDGDLLIESMGSVEGGNKDIAKKLARDAGIHTQGKGSFALVYQIWTKLDVDGRKRLCRAYYAGEPKGLGCKLNPHWNDRCPVLSAPVKKIPGLFKGESPAAACLDMQYLANDMANEMAHAMYFTLAPIVAVDPANMTKWKELISDVAAVWPIKPGDVSMLQWPNNAQAALEIIGVCQQKIFETLGVNPSILPQQTGKPKRNQAEVALEQQVDLLQTADAVTNFEGEILTPAVQRFAEYDMQFREKSMLVRQFGELGLMAGMERIPPIQVGNRWRLRWSGVEAARNAANIQQQIGWVGTVMKIPPQMYMGYRLDLAPLLEYSAGVVFPARLGRLVFRSIKDELTVPPETENELIAQGFEVQTHAADNDQQHLQAHMQAPQGPARDSHIRRHQLAMQMKQQAMAMQGQQGQRQPGGPGPRAGAMPAPGPKRPQQPAGTIHPDAMPRAGAVLPPRKT